MTGITGYDYEILWALYLKCKGYGAKVTKKSGDEGVDVIAFKDYKKIAYQCKFHSKPIRRDAIYEVHAGKDTYKCSRAIVVTNNTFTKPAKETAEKLSVGLLPNKTPESLIEACSQGYKEGNINQEDELFLQLPVTIRNAIIHGDKNVSENVNMDVVRERNGEVHDEDKIVEIPLIEKYVYINQKQKMNENQKRNRPRSDETYGDSVLEIENSEKTEKVCPVCGREFLRHSVMCPICKCSLVDLGRNKIAEENKAYTDNDGKPEKKTKRKFFYCCMSVAVLIYVILFFVAMYPKVEEILHTDKIRVTVASRDLKGTNYADAVKILQDAGFEYIELIEDADLILGLLKQEGEVGEVSINGKISFEKYEYFPKDAKIKITYHTFKPEFR